MCTMLFCAGVGVGDGGCGSDALCTRYMRTYLRSSCCWCLGRNGVFMHNILTASCLSLHTQHAVRATKRSCCEYIPPCIYVAVVCSRDCLLFDVTRCVSLTQALAGNLPEVVVEGPEGSQHGAPPSTAVVGVDVPQRRQSIAVSCPSSSLPPRVYPRSVREYRMMHTFFFFFPC